jgi:hypothetical protein
MARPNVRQHTAFLQNHKANQRRKGKQPVNPGGKKPTVSTRGTPAEFTPWYLRRNEPVNPGGKKPTVSTRGTPAEFMPWYLRRNEPVNPGGKSRQFLLEVLPPRLRRGIYAAMNQ